MLCYNKSFKAKCWPWMYYRRLLRRIKNYSINPVINFVVIIGSAKCGTTSLHKYLNFHPDIYMPSGVGINDETGLFLVNKDQKIKSLGNRKFGTDQIMRFMFTFYRTSRALPPGCRLALSANEAQH